MEIIESKYNVVLAPKEEENDFDYNTSRLARFIMRVGVIVIIQIFIRVFEYGCFPVFMVCVQPVYFHLFVFLLGNNASEQLMLARHFVYFKNTKNIITLFWTKRVF